MTSRERLAAALGFREPDRPPHFEQMFELVGDAFGREFPAEEELAEAIGAERQELFRQCASLYAQTVERFRWDAVLVWRPGAQSDVQYDFLRYLREYLDDSVPIGGFVWGSAISIDSVDDYMQFSVDLYENPRRLHSWAREMLDSAGEHARRLVEAGCELVDIANDYAFNSGPFISPQHFAEFTAPYMKELVQYVQGLGARVIFHSDGNLMPIMDQILAIGPDVLHSIDPMAGMDIKEVKARTHGRMALMGNVQCSYLQEGPRALIEESCEYALRHGSPGGGLIFSSSNTVFKGLPLANYEIMVNYLHQRFAS